MSSFVNFEVQEEFDLVNAATWGLEEDKFGGFKLPLIMLDFPIQLERIEKFVEEHDAENPIYGKAKTLYLKIKSLSKKQSDELLGKKIQDVRVLFKVTGLCKIDKGSFLIYKVTGLKRLDPKEEEPLSDLE